MMSFKKIAAAVMAAARSRSGFHFRFIFIILSKGGCSLILSPIMVMGMGKSCGFRAILVNYPNKTFPV